MVEQNYITYKHMLKSNNRNIRIMSEMFYMFQMLALKK